jgi:hypothetical protein
MCMGYVGCGARVSCSMIGWLCCSGLSEGAQVGTGSPPWYLLYDRWPVRSKGVLIIACGGSAVFLQCSPVLRVANPSNCGLPTCERSPSFRATPAVLLRCSWWRSTCRMYLWWDGRLLGRCTPVSFALLGVTSSLRQALPFSALHALAICGFYCRGT